MKIAIIGSRGYPYIYSGYETLVSELVSRLVARRHEVTVYCHRGLFKSYPVLVNGVRLRYIFSINSKIMSQFTNSLLSTLDALFRGYDIILYVNSANGPFGLLTQFARVRTAINVDGLEWLRPKWKGLGAKYFYLASKMATKYFDVVVTDSDRMAEIYQKEFGASSTVIAYGADLAVSEKPDLLHTYGLYPNGYYLVVGRMIPDNNAALIAEGFLQTETKRKLVIVGDVPYKDAYANTLRNMKDPRIVFTGYIRDQEVLRELYCNSYAYIHGHEFGGTNPTLLLALASGCCILALDTVFNREVLKNGDYGLLFVKRKIDVSTLIGSIEQDELLVKSFRKKAKDRIIERYTWDAIAGQYEDLFRRLIG